MLEKIFKKYKNISKIKNTKKKISKTSKLISACLNYMLNNSDEASFTSSEFSFSNSFEFEFTSKDYSQIFIGYSSPEDYLYVKYYTSSYICNNMYVNHVLHYNYEIEYDLKDIKEMLIKLSEKLSEETTTWLLLKGYNIQTIIDKINEILVYRNMLEIALDDGATF